MIPAPDHAYFPDDKAQHGQLSVNEIEALCLKAARGAGLSWGMAEEAGFAAGWLATHGIDATASLLALLDIGHACDWTGLSLQVHTGCWQAEGTAICPLTLGTALCDFMDLPQIDLANAPLETGAVYQPVLVLPFVSHLSTRLDHAVEVSGDRGKVTLNPCSVLSGDIAGFSQPVTQNMSLSLSSHQERVSPAPTVARNQTLAKAVARLNSFAMRTTVPSSEASRAGAGAKSGDND